MIHIILIEPRIPQNTGNIGRMCVCIGARLHLIHPLGFCINEKQLKRAGLDYWQYLEVREYENIQDFWRKNHIKSTCLESNVLDCTIRADSKREATSEASHYFLSTKAKKSIYEAPFERGSDCYLYFGREDQGISKNLLDKYASYVYKIPMRPIARSLNLATSVGIVAYEAFRKRGELL